MTLFNFSHPWNINFHVLFLFYVTTLSLTSFSSNSVSPSKIQYSDHCAAFVRNGRVRSVASPLPIRRHRGHYVPSKSDVPTKIPSSLVLYLWGVHETDVQGLFGVEANLTLFRSRTSFYGGNISSHSSYSMHYNYSPVFRLKGFWSQSSGKLCVVGHGYYRSRRPRGESNTVPVLLKLNNLFDSSNLTSLITGSLESLVGPDQNDPNHFDRISVLFFPEMNYEYSSVSEALVAASDSESGVGLALDSMTSSVCALMFYSPLSLKYSGRCRVTRPAKNCSPLGEPQGQLPDIAKLQILECSEFGQRLRLLIKFPIGDSDVWNSRTLYPKATLVGEGVWDSKKNRLFVVACRFLNVTDSWAEARVGDCSTRLSLRFPAIWTIGSTSSIVGHIWSTKTAADSGYFDKIRFELLEGGFVMSQETKYEYTKIDKAKKWCPRKETAKGKSYPDAFSNDMSFDIRNVKGKRRFQRGYSQPISVGNELYSLHWSQKNATFLDTEPQEVMSTVSYVNYLTKISYMIKLFNVSGESNDRFDISAEGIYDVSTGSLCMIGCRIIGSNSSNLSSDDDTFDCEILVHFQFPARGSKLNEGFIKGSIESKRKKSDPLFFESLELSSASYVAFEAQESVRLADWEIILGLISNTLACVFAVFQIFHLKRNPDIVPFVSLTMLFTLTFGYTIPLVMNLKSMLVTSFESQDVLLGTGGWLEAKAVIEVVTALILFLLQARLLQLTWSARLSHENQQALRIAENEALVVSLPLYFGGAFLSLFFAWSKRNRDLATLSFALITSYYDNPIWKALKSYADMLSDGFLLPQILLNMFRDSRERALSCSFYIGTTFVRLLPHVFGLYKAQNSGLELVSTLWDVIIPFVSLLFAAIVYLQHKFGGRCILPFRSRESNAFEKVSNVVAETET